MFVVLFFFLRLHIFLQAGINNYYLEKLNEKLVEGKWKEEPKQIEKFIKYHQVTLWRMVERKLPLFLPEYVGGGIQRGCQEVQDPSLQHPPLVSFPDFDGP